MRRTVPLVLLWTFAFPGAPPARADGGLEIGVSVARREVASGDAVQLVAAIRNAGPGPVRLHLPEFHAQNAFPRFTLTDERGGAYAPYDAPFQSMWQEGLLGEILTLAPGAARSFPVDCSHFVRAGPTGDGAARDPGPLPPGRYEVVAEYAKEDDRVPYAREAFRTEWVREPGLWTGTVRSAPVVLVVGPSGRPTLVLDAPAQVLAGAPFPIRLSLENPGPDRLEVVGAFVVRVHSKAWGGATYRAIFVDRLLDAEPAQVHALSVDAGGSADASFDLAARTLLREGRPVGLYDVVPEGEWHLEAQFVPESASAPLASAGGMRRVVPQEPGAVGGLVLRLETSSRPLGLGPTVEVVLENRGPEPVRVPSGLDYPRHVFFAIRGSAPDARTRYAVEIAAEGGLLLDPDEPGIRAQLPEGWTWSGGAFEPRVGDERLGVATLAPGASLRRRVHLPALLAGSDASTMSHGAWEVRAFWRNRESGSRLGVSPPMATGLLASEPLLVRGRGW
jgi:hypothetical protein